MAEYIEREPLLESLRESYETLKLIRSELKYEKAIALEDAQLITFMECILRVKEQPAADVVEVVRCCKCKYWEFTSSDVLLEIDYGKCTNCDSPCHSEEETTGGNYCPYGERRCEE